RSRRSALSTTPASKRRPRFRVPFGRAPRGSVPLTADRSDGRSKRPAEISDLRFQTADLGNVRRLLRAKSAICNLNSAIGLPAIVREGLVGLGHPVRVLASLDRVPGPVRGVEELGGKLFGHRAAGALARGVDEPAHREGVAAIAANLDR